MGKAPKVTGWQMMTNVGPGTVRDWEESYPDHLNTGLLAGHTPGLDIDILDRAAAQAVEALVREWFKGKGKILVRTGRAPKRLIPFRVVEPFRKKAIAFIPTVTPAGEERREKIELLADGQQFVAFGVHPDTGRPYTWRGGEPGKVKPEDLPQLDEAEAEALVEAAANLLISKHGYARNAPDDARAPGTGSKPGSAEERLLNVDPSIRHELIMQLVDAIPNDTVDHGGDWIAVLHGIKGASGDPDWGKIIWLAYCARWTKGEADPDEDERVWNTARLGDGFSGIRQLLELAWRAGTPEAIAAVEAVKLARAQEAFKDPPDDLPDNDDPEPAPARDPWSRLRAELHWSGADRARNSGSGIAWREPGIAVFGSESREGMPRDRAWITDRHVRGYITTTNGLPTAGKSFLSVTFANAIATERHDLAGLDRIERPGAVVIIAADSEGAEEFQRKDAAFRQYHGLTNADFKHQIFIFDAPGPFVEMRARTGTWGPSRWIIEQAPKLARMREDNKLALIVVDTLLGVSGGGNTADAVDMQAIIDVAKTLATVLDCAVEIINHLTKGGAKADPGSMDAGLGARPITATARFVANLSKVNGVVTIVMPKESYMGGPRGTRCFEFKPVDVPVAIYDVDDNYVGVEPRSLGVLIPAEVAALERMAEDTALAALWEAHRQGVKIKRGAAKGRQGDDHAALIVQKALDFGLDPRGRRKAEALVEKLLQEARVKAVPALDDKRNRFEQLVPDDPADEI